MKIISNTLEPIIERWDDPGDYPSGAGGGPLPSYKYIAGCEGELVVEIDHPSLLDIGREMDMLDPDTTPPIDVKKWSIDRIRLVGAKVIVHPDGVVDVFGGSLQVYYIVDECDGDVPEPEREYERDED